MQLLDAIFVRPRELFLKTILKEQDLSREDVKGFLKAINEDLEILLPHMNQVNKMIKSNRTSNAKWYECRVMLTHLIDCMVTVLPVIQAALNDAICDLDRIATSRKPAKLNQFKLDPPKIIRKMMRLMDNTSQSKNAQIFILSDAAKLFSSMLLICNRWLKTMIAAEGS
jgi:hypothetical protein